MLAQLRLSVQGFRAHTGCVRLGFKVSGGAGPIFCGFGLSSHEVLASEWRSRLRLPHHNHGHEGVHFCGIVQVPLNPKPRVTAGSRRLQGVLGCRDTSLKAARWPFPGFERGSVDVGLSYVHNMSSKQYILIPAEAPI